MNTWKEAILKVLKEDKRLVTSREIFTKINNENLYDWGNAQTPQNTVASILSRLEREDSRIRKVKKDGNWYYYWREYENKLLDEFDGLNNGDDDVSVNYRERDLHKLFVSYLRSEDIFAKTLFHERNRRGNNSQKWVNPDIVGVSFAELRHEISSIFQKNIKKNHTFNLYSYELKREINNDYSLKESYFQTVSNSSWANYGYLVALEINDKYFDKIARLNKTFGIGVIKLSPNPFETKVLFPAKRKEIDFPTIDKLISINEEFKEFIEKLNNILDSSNRNLEETLKRDFKDIFCDDFFTVDSDHDIKMYCEEIGIKYPQFGNDVI